MKIYLDKESMKHKENIISHIEHEISWNPDFSGSNYEIFEDEYTWIDKVDEIAGSILIGQINDLVDYLENK